MEIFKFGGASLKNTSAIINMGLLIERSGHDHLIVVVSAMGKTTNALEIIFSKARNQINYSSDIENLKAYHFNIASELFGSDNAVREVIDPVMQDLLDNLKKCVHINDYDEAYDSIIPFGELLSSTIVFNYLKTTGKKFNFRCKRSDHYR